MMKKIMSTFLVLFMAGGFHAMAEEVTLPAVKEAAPAKAKQPAEKERTSVKDNIFYGGYINLSLGNYMVIGVEPMVGYKVTPQLSAGIKLRYDYIKDDRYARSYTTSTYGGSIFGRYLVTPKFYAHVEPAMYNYEYFPYDGERDWVPFLFVGGGVTQPLGERSWLNAQILFDVLQDEKSTYDDWTPFFSIGVGSGF